MATNNQIFPDNPNIKVLKSGKTGLFCNYVFKAIPLAFDESLSYYECLCGLLDYLKNVIIPTVNNNAEAVSELQNLYVDLHDYVENYFTNLDVQEEINNKLDEMVEQGTLQEIIADYLNSKAVFGYDTVDDMKNATNLINGSYARTLGYYSLNDEGGATYKITDEINESEYQEELTNGLYATLIITDTCNIKQFGATGNGETDDTIPFQKAINQTNTLFIPEGTYAIDNIFINKTIEIKGSGNKSILYKRDNGSDNLITIEETQYVCIHDLMLQGNFERESLNNGIWINNRNNWGGRHHIYNLRIYYFNGYGLYIGSKNQGNLIHNLRIHYTKNDCMYIHGADNVLHSCILTNSTKFGLNYEASDSTISNMRINDNNTLDTVNCGGLRVGGDNILTGIMLQNNRVHDIILYGSYTKIDYITNMLNSINNLSSSCKIEGNYNTINLSLHNGKSGKFCDYILNCNDNIIGNEININYYNDYYSTGSSIKALSITNKYTHPSNIINYKKINYNRYINIFNEIIRAFNSVNTGAIDLTKNDYNEYVYNTNLNDINNNQRIIITTNISNIENGKKLYVSYDYDSNLPSNSSYVYECFLWDNTRNVLQRPITQHTYYAKGHIDAIFEIDTTTFNPDTIRMCIRKVNNDYVNDTPIIYSVSNIIISKEI